MMILIVASIAGIVKWVKAKVLALTGNLASILRSVIVLVADEVTIKFHRIEQGDCRRSSAVRAEPS